MRYHSLTMCDVSHGDKKRAPPTCSAASRTGMDDSHVSGLPSLQAQGHPSDALPLLARSYAATWEHTPLPPLAVPCVAHPSPRKAQRTQLIHGDDDGAYDSIKHVQDEIRKINVSQRDFWLRGFPFSTRDAL